MAETIFSKIINREIPAKIIYEDDFVLAFEDINAQAPLHALVIPKREIPTINDASPEDAELLGKVLLAAASIAKSQGLAERGYRLVINCNSEAGQTVFHLHCHLLGGRTMAWPPG
ncbi:MAG: histidine triad nucleotide-binding protein [Candidatus Kapabacteria bacterium]|nr:histidine triad nucleotide-binding protein [Candidatus Kapabacteria bacterium]